MRPRSWLIIAVGPLVAGCGATGRQTTPVASPPPDTIVMGDFSFTPATLTVLAGTTVTMRNDGRIEHTAADVDASGGITSRVIKPVPLATGQSLTITFTRPGTYHYICTFHPKLMDGTVVVTAKR